ncbi:MAG: rod shape-determining protein RodA [Clostridiales Family XIII bacterium]|jgi:rod shape determining protein RodA|nr:rod shape-determining protein RodA [Clostridiales Family XIII bacterium]
MGPVLETIKRIDKILLVLPILFGLMSVFMISSITASADDPLSQKVVVQIAAYAVGFVFLALCLIFDYKILLRIDRILYGLAILVQCTVYIPGLGEERYGSRAWVNLGITTVQPSELVKIIFVVVMAAWLTRHREDLKTVKGFLIAFLYGIPIVGIVLIEDMGSGIVMAFMLIGLIFAAGLKTGIFLRFAAVLVVLVPVIYRFLDPYQKERFSAFLHPDDLSIQATYQVYQAKVAIGSGGLFGKGFREGAIKVSNLLPVQESDFIFPIICEEFGLLGGLAVIVLYGVLLGRIWLTVAKATELFGALIAVGYMCMFGVQIFENIGMTMGLMPVTGITLPFLSAGGSSVLANMIAIGLILGIKFRDSSRKIKYK